MPRSYRDKIRSFKDGRQIGAVAFRSGALSQLLKNPIATSHVRHKDKIYEGEHEAIMDGTQPVNLAGRKLARANAVPPNGLRAPR